MTALSLALAGECRCPRCDGAGCWPAVWWDGSQFPATCELCTGQGWVDNLSAIDWLDRQWDARCDEADR